MRKLEQISIHMIRPDPSQPRKEFNEEAIFELAQSIQKNGLLQPITVKKDEDGYIIIAGERRYRAVCSLEWETIDCIIYNGNSAKELQLVENINRADLNPMEVAEAYQGYLEDGHGLEELAEVVGKPKNIISWLLNITQCMPEIQHMIRRDQISLVVAISLSKLTQNGQLKALRIMQANKLSVGECQKLGDAIYSEEHQIEMFAEEPKLSEEEIAARRKVESALEKACQCFVQINKLETDNPGITAQAVYDKLDVTQEKVEMLYREVGKLRTSLRSRRVAALC